MTDNPIEVQEARETVIRAFEKCLLEPDENATEDYCGVALDAYRTAILKHDPVVTGFDDVAGDAERLIALLRIILPTEDRMPSGTFEAIDAVQGRLQRALEAYRTAVSEDHDEG